MTSETQALLERLRAIDEEAMYQAPATSHLVINLAADTIEALTTALDEADFEVNRWFKQAETVLKQNEAMAEAIGAAIELLNRDIITPAEMNRVGYALTASLNLEGK